MPGVSILFTHLFLEIGLTVLCDCKVTEGEHTFLKMSAINHCEDCHLNRSPSLFIKRNESKTDNIIVWPRLRL